MDSQRQESNSIIFNNQLYHKRTSSKVLCLNPNCKANRLIELQRKAECTRIVHKDHQTCLGWIHSLNKLRKQYYRHDRLQPDLDLSTDYLQQPIDSIYQMQAFSSVRWEDELFKYFQQLKVSIDEQIGKIYIKCQRDINNHLEVNRQVFQKLQTLCQTINGKWEENHQEYYKDHLQEDLKKIQNMGLVKISNKQILATHFNLVLEQLKTIQLCIWNKELEYDFLERISVKAQKQELVNFDIESNVHQNINNKIHSISASLKSPIKYIQEQKILKVVCFACPITLYSKASNIKQRKQQCRTSLLDHFLNCHIDKIVSRSSIGSSLKLNLDDLKRQVIGKNIKKVIVVDKENMGTFNSVILNDDPECYCVEIVSKNNENIAKGRYLVAESKGKDAADIMIIIVLWQLSKLKLQKIMLLTKDHYGETLQPIFDALGVKITISDNIEPTNFAQDLDSCSKKIKVE